MNCKPGDVAVIIMNIDHNRGRLVVVDRPYGTKDYEGYGSQFCWHVESLGGKLMRSDGRLSWSGYIPDIALRPIDGVQMDVQAVVSERADMVFQEAMADMLKLARELENQKVLVSPNSQP